MSYITITPHRFGLGIAPAAVPVAASVVKNTFGFIKRLFGPKPLIFGLKPEEFKARHDNATWFRALWYDGYWVREGASEIPAGMSLQDYYVGRFGLGPFWADDVTMIDRLRRGGVPLESLRLTSIPAGMRIPSGVSQGALKRVLPQPVIQRLAPAAAVMRAAPVTPEAATAGVSELLRSPVVLTGLGLAGFMLMQTMMRSAPTRR